jgi:hypothetical protein
VPVDVLLARLQDRPDEVAAALGGRVLSIELVLTEGRHPGWTVVFSPDGHISALRHDRPGPLVAADVRFQGTAKQVLRVVLGETDTAHAVFTGVVELALSPAELTPHYPRVMALVREEASDLLVF